ncbi:tetratricopeptide repeat protein [Aequorivita sp. F47161]|uniref:Tetratricopeptide repeat protein n=1 Tax=Aequorivita vitellina TaxID=2874475 RepID=A0A9X1U4E5_9FLAO|nr:tetratricopeptide repeat protein [Aequorivita vitellina]MCG2420227.1 tetratricopeptide repeat protein [Aequorivita vitellina]
MLVKNLHVKCVWFAAIVLLPLVVSSQSKIDSILTIATQQIYENPDISIKLGSELLNETDISADEKVRIILIISTAYSSKRDYEKSLENTLKALDLLPKLTDVYLKINLLNRIGGQYQELKIYDKAINYLNQAKQLIEETPENDVTIRGLGYNNLVRGFVYREQMSCDIALNYFDKAIEDYKKILNHPAGKANISTSYYNRGNCLISLGRPNEAESSFKEAVKYAKTIDAKSLVAFAQKGLAEVYTSQGEYKKAIALIIDALQNSEDVGDKVLNRALYNALATNYLATGNLKDYSLYKSKNLEVHRELTKAERQTVDNSINDLIDTNSEKLKSVKKSTKFLQIGFSSLILLCIIFLIRTVFTSEKELKSLKKRLKF